MEKDESVIPKGLYCYSLVKSVGQVMTTKRCPYWSIDLSRPEQENGFCSFLDQGDWDLDGGGLLWDQVKSCNINEDDIGDWQSVGEDEEAE